MNTKQWLSNYRSEIYAKYLSRLELYLERKNMILKSGKTADRYFRENTMSFELKHGNINLKLIKPLYGNVIQLLDSLRQRKSELMFTYRNLQYKLTNDFADDSDYKSYSSIVKELTNITEQIEAVIEYHIQVNTPNRIERDQELIKLDKLIASKDSVYQEAEQETDDILRRRALSEYFELLKEIDELYKKTLSQRQVNRIDIYIEKLPQITEDLAEVEDLPPPSKKKKLSEISEEELDKAKREKLKRKLREKLQKKTAEELQALPSKTIAEFKEEMFKEFKFKSVRECESTDKKALYYMKKAEILEIIKRYPTLATKLPSNYARLTRGDLCKAIYSL